MLRTAQQDAERHDNEVSVWTEQEPGGGGKESAEATVRLLAGFPVHTETVTGSKEVRAEAFAAQAEARQHPGGPCSLERRLPGRVARVPKRPLLGSGGRFVGRLQQAGGAVAVSMSEEHMPFAIGDARRTIRRAAAGTSKNRDTFFCRSCSLNTFEEISVAAAPGNRRSSVRYQHRQSGRRWPTT